MRTSYKRKTLLLLFFSALMVGIIFLSLYRDFRGPIYQGKTVQEWLESYEWKIVGGIQLTQTITVPIQSTLYQTNPKSVRIISPTQYSMQYVFTKGGKYENPSLVAIRTMGKEALPTLKRIINREESPLHQRYEACYQSMPPNWQKLLPSPSLPAPKLRENAVEALSKMNLPNVLYASTLIDLLDDASPQIRQIALNGLERAGQLCPADHKRLDDYVATRPYIKDAFEIVQRLEPGGIQEVAVYSKILKDPVLRSWALNQMVSGFYLPNEALPGLVQVLGTSSPTNRQTAAQILRFMGPRAETAVPHLIPLLSDIDPETRYQAARALEAIGPASRAAIPALIHVLDDTNSLAPNVARRFLNTLSNNAAMPTAKSGQ